MCPPSQGRRNHLPKGQNRSHGPYQVVNVRFFDVGLRVVFRCIDIWNSLALLMGIVLPFACCLDIYKPRDDVILHKPSWNQVSRKDSSWGVVACSFVYKLKFYDNVCCYSWGWKVLNRARGYGLSSETNYLWVFQARMQKLREGQGKPWGKNVNPRACYPLSQNKLQSHPPAPLSEVGKFNEEGA